MISWLAFAWALFVAGASATSLFRVLRRAATRPAHVTVTHRLILLRPCAGAENDLEARLAKSGGTDLVVFAVDSPADPATVSAHRAARSLRARGTGARVVHTRARGPNHKAAQLAKAVAKIGLAPDDVLVVADSDVDLDATDLHLLVAPFADRDVGAAWAAPIEAGPVVSLGDRIAHAVLGSSLHAFPFLAGIDRTGMVGKLFAVRAGALADAGGFGALVDRLGEDVALARALHRAKWKVRVASVVAPSIAAERTAAAVVARLARWVHVVRSERPWLLPSYPLLFAPTALALAAFVTGIASGDRVLAASGALVLLSRLTIAGGSIRDVIFGDGALLAAFVRALTQPTFTWRGRLLSIGRDGRLREERPRDPGEDSLRNAGEDARTTSVDDLEFGRVAAVDARELGKKGVALFSDGHDDRRIVHPAQRRADRDPQIGSLRRAEDVAHADRQDATLLRAARDPGRPRPELERRERRTLASLREDPHRSSRPFEERGGVTNGASTVARVLDIDAERTDEAEERKTLEVSGIHHRVRLDAEEIGDEDRDERIPPGGVVRDDEDRAGGRRLERRLAAVHEDATERRVDSAAHVAREPAEERGRTTRGDHRRSR